MSLKLISLLSGNREDRETPIAGTGYPKGLGAEDIPLEVRIISGVDVFTALATDRPCRSTVPALAAGRARVVNAGTGR